MTRRGAILLLLALLGCGRGIGIAEGPQGGEGTTTVVVVRHAERAEDGTSDPPLSDAGRERATALARALAPAEVAAVFATQYRRTRETAAALGAEVTVRPVTAASAASYARDLAAEIRDHYAGRTVLVVGHSNTVPEIVAALGGGAIEPIAEDEYGRMYRLVIAGGEVRVHESQYP